MGALSRCQEARSVRARGGMCRWKTGSRFLSPAEMGGVSRVSTSWFSGFGQGGLREQVTCPRSQGASRILVQRPSHQSLAVGAPCTHRCF